MSHPSALADPSSLLGQLQRGRGSGFRRALAAHPADVRPLLFDCVTRDPRWCRQLEARGGYYADLLIHTGADLRPFAAHLRMHDDVDPHSSEVWLLLDTLGALARRGVGFAVAVIREYVGWGTHWEAALIDLADLESPAAASGVDVALCRRIASDDELRGALWMADPEREPWRGWMRTNARMERLIRQNEREHAECRAGWEGPADLLGLSLQELFQRAESPRQSLVQLCRVARERAGPEDVPFLLSQIISPERARCHLALAALASVADDRCVVPLAALVERGGRFGCSRIRLLGALRGLPAPLLLPLARRWFASPESHVREIGCRLLATDAEQEDLDALRAAVSGSVADGDMYRLCSLLEGLERLQLPASMPEVEGAWVAASYSWAQAAAARVLHRCSPHTFARDWAPECLWDSDDRLRLLGCETVDPAAEGVRERLEELAAAPWEDPKVQSAARRRLLPNPVAAKPSAPDPAAGE